MDDEIAFFTGSSREVCLDISMGTCMVQTDIFDYVNSNLDALTMQITSERLTYWFFRLNGFLTIPNFIVHSDQGTGQRTDIDVLGVRFPNRIENQVRPMADHPHFCDETLIHVVLAETKRLRCGLNKAWTDDSRGNLERVLFAGGFVPRPEVPEVAGKLYETGGWQNELMRVSLVAAGSKCNRTLQRALPNLRQICWADDVLPFIHGRFWNYLLEKNRHSQWDQDAQNLFEAVEVSGGDLEAFMTQVEITDATE